MLHVLEGKGATCWLQWRNKNKVLHRRRTCEWRRYNVLEFLFVLVVPTGSKHLMKVHSGAVWLCCKEQRNKEHVILSVWVMWQKLWANYTVKATFCYYNSSPTWVLPMDCSSSAGGYLLHHGPPWTAGEQPTSPWSSSQAAREGSLLRHFEYLFPPPSSLTLVSAELFLSHCLNSLYNCCFTPEFFFPFLNMFPQMCYHHHWLDWPWPASWHWLYQRWGKLLTASHRSHPYSPLLPKPWHTNP